MTSSDSDFRKDKVLKLVQHDGLLSRNWKGFEPRAQQQDMMANVLDAYQEDRIALIEAGTGIGKSIAYLIPALLWAARRNERTVISTNTITLQEQLIHKDIPNLMNALNLKLKAVLVKGMNNYICLRKLEDSQAELRLFPTEESEEMQKIEAWRHQQAGDGSRSELPFVPSPAVWDRVGAESEACSHHECPYYQQCYFFKARRQASDAQILVVNHHLLFADLFRRGDTDNYSNPSLLPVYKRVILDEAHHIEDIATEYFAARLHRLEMMRILGRLSSERQNKPFGKLPLLKEKLQLLYNKAPPRDVSSVLTKLTIDLPALRRQLNDRINETFEGFIHFLDHLRQPASSSAEENAQPESKLRILKEHHEHAKWSEDIIPRTEQLITALKQYAQGLNGLESDLKMIENDRLQEQTKGLRLDIQSLVMRLESAIYLLHHFIKPSQDPNKVRWIETQKLKVLTNLHLVDADLDVSKALVNFLFSKFPTIVLCSATLTSNKSFSFIRQRLGLDHNLLAERPITEHIYDSPFNYQKQALLAVPTDMPLPSHPEFNQMAYENIWKAVQASHGNAFVLFTSYSMLQSCYEAISARCKEQGYRIFKQGEDNRQSLLNQFKKTDHSILLGTDSFWEGVDVAGDALRCVIIVKLPFKVPTEPIIQARTEAIFNQGREPFLEYSVPHAIVKFKQGFGRLIRHQWDRGCIVCLDTRLISKGYGKLFLNSLPNCDKIFTDSLTLQKRMAEFYRRTYHFVQKNPFSSKT